MLAFFIVKKRAKLLLFFDIRKFFSKIIWIFAKKVVILQRI